MNHFYCRRRDSDSPRWKVVDGDTEVVALCETQAQGEQLASQLNELRRLRVLLAVAANTLTMAQACAILNCRREDIERMTNGCLAKGFK